MRHSCSVHRSRSLGSDARGFGPGEGESSHSLTHNELALFYKNWDLSIVTGIASHTERGC